MARNREDRRNTIRRRPRLHVALALVAFCYGAVYLVAAIRALSDGSIFDLVVYGVVTALAATVIWNRYDALRNQ